MNTKAIAILASLLVCGVARDVRAQFGQPVRASQIMERTVKDSAGKKLGTVRDLAIDLENGRIVEVVVSSGGFLGVDSKIETALPQNFTVENDGKTLLLNISKEKLAGSPAVDFGKWRDSVAQSQVENTYQYYGATPYFLVPFHRAQDANKPYYIHLGPVQRLTHLLTAETENQEGRKLGKVKDAIIDFSQGRVMEVVIASGNFLGVPNDLSAVPPQVLRFDDSRNVATLSTTKDQMFEAPHFPANAWPAIDRTQATDVYQAWHVVPYFLPIGNETSER